MTIERLMIALVLVATLLFADWCSADERCQAWAGLVERLEAMPEVERERVVPRWVEVADRKSKRYILSAINWIRQGQSSAAAWRECGSI